MSLVRLMFLGLTPPTKHKMGEPMPEGTEEVRVYVREGERIPEVWVGQGQIMGIQEVHFLQAQGEADWQREGATTESIVAGPGQAVGIEHEGGVIYALAAYSDPRLIEAVEQQVAQG